MIQVRCGCGKRLNLTPDHLGMLLECRACRTALRVVSPEGSTASSEPTGLLVVRAGPTRVGEQIFLASASPIQVGKLPGSDILLQGPSVSRTHCRLVPCEGGWRVEDEASTNGVYVNRQKVVAQTLMPGDRIRVGDYRFKYVDLSDADKTAAGLPSLTPAAASPEELPPAEALPVEPGEGLVPSADVYVVDEPSSPPDDDIPIAQAVDDGTFAIADDEWAELASGGETVVRPDIEETFDSTAAGTAVGGGSVCPCCERTLMANAKICVQCGINVKTGRSLLTAHETDLNEAYITAESIIRLISWVIPFGIYPFASEAFGTTKPHVIRAIAVVTVCVSLWFTATEWFGSQGVASQKNLMLWSPDAGTPDAEMLAYYYTFTDFGDSEAFWDRFGQILEAKEEMTHEEAMLQAHASLSPEQQFQGHYQSSQLITHAFLHGGLLHLIGNLLFLLVFGSRVNAILGNIGVLILYPILAIGAAWSHLASVADQPPVPMVGASGAIMGLAGMYFVFAPMHRMHMAAWMRWGLFVGFALSLKLWALRGFWVVLLYIGFDVAFTAAGVDDGTAHWAHLGGFIVGAAIALLLLFARLVNCRGGDLVTAILGRHAWGLVGKPNR
ncbi:MAG: rhomboid family intramembrane serine protease [Phycisphaerae bacterium]